MAWSTAEHSAHARGTATTFRDQGLDIYAPNVDAFRQAAQQKYLDSELSGLARGNARPDQRALIG
jgi:TRAP-type transport system periplasmic protein